MNVLLHTPLPFSVFISRSDSTLQSYSHDWHCIWIINVSVCFFFSQNDLKDCSSLLRCFPVCVTERPKDPCSSSHPAVFSTNTLWRLHCGNAHTLRDDAAILWNIFCEELGRRVWFCQESTATLAVLTLCVAVVAGGTTCTWVTAVQWVCTWTLSSPSVCDSFLLASLPFQYLSFLLFFLFWFGLVWLVGLF